MNPKGELDDIDIDLDQLLDMEDDQARRHWLQVSSVALFVLALFAQSRD